MTALTAGLAAYSIAPHDKIFMPNSLSHSSKRLIIELENNNTIYNAGQSIRGFINVEHLGPCFPCSELRLSLRGYEHLHQTISKMSEVELQPIVEIRLKIADVLQQM